MSDERLRELERRWKETGSVEDQAALLQEQVRAGVLRREDVWIAALLSSPAARLAAQDADLSDSYDVADWNGDTILGGKALEAVTRDGRGGETGLRILLAVARQMQNWSEHEAAQDLVAWDTGRLRQVVGRTESALSPSQAPARPGEVSADTSVEGESDELDWIAGYLEQFTAGQEPSGFTFQQAVMGLGWLPGLQRAIEAALVPWLLGTG